MERKKSLRRYHYQVYYPPHTSAMLAEFFHQLAEDPYVTYHAAYQMCDDPRSIIAMPTKADLLQANSKLVEFYENIDADGHSLNTIQKVLIRVTHLHHLFDYTYLLAREGFIVSAWCSHKTDVHRLTKSLYSYYCPTSLKQNIYKRFKTTDGLVAA